MIKGKIIVLDVQKLLGIPSGYLPLHEKEQTPLQYISEEMDKYREYRGTNPEGIILNVETATLYGIPMFNNEQAYNEAQEQKKLNKLPRYY